MKVLFLGSKELGLKCLKKIAEMDKISEITAMTIDDRKDGRSKFKEWIHFAKNRNLRLIVSKNRLDAERVISEIQPDIAFVVGWYWLIDAILLKAVHKGFIGVHNSLLPHYRGWAPVSWATMNGEREIGVSLFRFSDQMDDGPIYAQKKIRTSPEWYLDDSLKSLESATLKMLEETYFPILKGTLEPKPQEGILSYGARRRPQQYRLLQHLVATQSAPDWLLEPISKLRLIADGL